MQEYNPRPSNDIVPIHIVVHQQNDDLKIDFDFNKKDDNIDTVVSELIETLGMTESDKENIKALIEQQINHPKQKSNQRSDTFFEPIGFDTLPSNQSDDTSDDSDITDPDYRSLKEQQKREMDALLAQHLSEKRELAQRIQASEMHQIQQLQQQQQQIQQPQVQQPQTQPQQTPQAQPPQPPPPNSVQPNPPIVLNTGQQGQHPPSASPIPIINVLSAGNPPTNSICDDLIDFK